MAVIDINALVVAQTLTENASKKAMIYTSDTGLLHTVNIDENIGEAMGFADYTGVETTTNMPDGLRMRTVTFADATGKIKGQYPCGAPTTLVFKEGGTIKVPRKGNITGVVCSVTGAQGEKRRILAAADTAQNAGDAT